MGLGNLFKLAKLTIAAYDDVERSAAIGKPIEVQYNPESLSLKHESVFQNKQGIATSSAQARFSHSRSKQLDVTLVFDGTQVGYFGLERLRHVPTVAERIKEFLTACYKIQGETHEPSYLKLSWDKGVLGPSFDCRLQSASVNYTAFDRDGSPLHATLTAVFVEDLDPKKKASSDRLASPDLSHRRVVRSGDTLPLLCREIYGSSVHYLRVAEANGLDDFRELEPGIELIFPPFDRRGSS
ncbi:CIS tube protein [Nannocystaceae bacterium ST9]